MHTGGAKDAVALMERSYRASARLRDSSEKPGSLLDAPLICARWAGALPGVLQSLHISDPALIHVFEELCAADGRHGRFGYFEAEDPNHSPYLALSGPGVLMQLRDVRRLGDGRLVVLALAVVRVRTQRITNDTPFLRGDLLFLPDEEEQAAARLSLRQGGLCAEGPELNEAARVASAAAALTWAAAETEQQWAAGPGQGAGTGAGRDGPPLPESAMQSGALEERAPLNLSLSISTTAKEARLAAARAAELSRDLTRSAAPMAAEDALSRALEAHYGAATSTSGAGSDTASSISEGTASTQPLTLGLSFDSYSQPFLLALEQALWREMVLCILLSAKLQSTQPNDAAELHALAELLPLVPPPPAHGWPLGMPASPSSAVWLSRFGYPPLRRAQRLSFLMAALLPQLATVTLLPPKLERPALLRMASVRERLQAGVVFLGHQRLKLAALVALNELRDH